MAPRVVARLVQRLLLHVVLHDEAPRHPRRGLRLMQVGRLRQAEQAPHPVHQPLLMLRCRLLRTAGRAGIDAPIGADLLKGCSVRRLVLHPQHLAHKLVRHLMLEHLEDLAPGRGRHEGLAELHQPRPGDPTTEHRLQRCQRHGGRPHHAAEEQPIGLAPLQRQRRNHRVLTPRLLLISLRHPTTPGATAAGSACRSPSL